MKKICSRLWGFLLLPVYLFASLGLHVCETEAATVKLESKVYNPGGNTLSDYWKCTNEDVLTWLGKHINDDYYLGTSYDTGSLDSSNGDSRNDCDWRSPKGDISTRDGHPGFNDVAGQAAMNCTGFVWHVIYKAGQLAGNDWSKSEAVQQVPCWGGVGAGAWSAWLKSHNVEYKTYWAEKRYDKYDFDGFMQEVVNDGYIQPGDIIWTWRGDINKETGIGGVNVGGYSPHTGIYLGGYFDNKEHLGSKYWNECGSTQWWHSSFFNNVGKTGIGKYNAINTVIPKTDCSCITVVKFSNTADLSLQKNSSSTSVTEENQCYSLEGAVYGVYSDKECKTQQGTLTTDEKGNTKAITLRCGRYYVKEIKAPKGYALDATVHPVELTESRVLKIKEKPVYDSMGLEICKVDCETKKAAALGGASLKGAQFTVKYYDGYYEKETLPGKPKRTWVLETKEKKAGDKISYPAELSKEYKVSGDDLYYENGAAVLPLGTITVEETKAPEGYLLKDSYLQAVGSTQKTEGIYLSQITQDHNAAHLAGGNSYTVSEQVKRGDLELIKIENTSSKRMADTAFRITSKTTGENHVLVTDENGYTSTDNSYLVHSNHTNINDTHTEDCKFDGSAGIWFGIDTDEGEVDVRDDLGALPYDTYIIEELSCPANKGKTLIPAFEIVISRDKYTVDLGTLTNDDKPKAVISKLDAATGKQLEGAVLELYKKTDGEWKLVAETVTTDNAWTYAGEAGTYKLVEVKAPTGYQMAEEVLFTIYDGEIVHRVEMEDEPLTIHTTAVNQEDGTKVIFADEKVTILDTVEMEGLTVGRDYRLIGWEMIQSENTELVVDGERMEGVTEFTAEDKDMSAEVEITIDAGSFIGLNLVTFEELYDVTDPDEPILVAEHKDIEDEGQTVSVEAKEKGISIHTTAVHEEDGEKMLPAGKEVTIRDTVEMEGLEAGREYELCGWQMIQMENAELLEDGKMAENSMSFTAESSSMTVELEFTFDSKKWEGYNLVTFEELYDVTDPESPVLVAEHKNLYDKGQTVTVEAKEKVITEDMTMPKTGDNQKTLMVLIVLLILSCAAIFICVKISRKTK